MPRPEHPSGGPNSNPMVGGYSNEDREAEMEELRVEKEREARRKAAAPVPATADEEE